MLMMIPGNRQNWGFQSNLQKANECFESIGALESGSSLVLYSDFHRRRGRLRNPLGQTWSSSLYSWLWFSIIVNRSPGDLWAPTPSWRPFGLLTSSFAPYGRSGRVTQAKVTTIFFYLCIYDANIHDARIQDASNCDACIHDAHIHDACVHDACMHNACIYYAWSLTLMHVSMMYVWCIYLWSSMYAWCMCAWCMMLIHTIRVRMMHVCRYAWSMYL